MCTECTQDYEEPSTELSADAEERRSALFKMRVTDELSLGHSGVDSLCSATQSFVETVTDSISQNIKQALSESGITDETLLTAVSNACHTDDLFSHISSRYQREKYYEKNFHYVVSTITIIRAGLINFDGPETRAYLPWQ